MILAAISIIAIALFITAAKIAEQIQKFIVKLRQTTEINSNAYVEVDSNDEFRELANVYNAMLERIDLLIQQVYKQQLLMKDAQIESLQAQINPHFLYNTLDCINSLADMGKTTEVKKTVTSLGSIMRMSIKGAQFLKIEEELKYVNQYLYIQKMRFQEHIICLVEIPEQLYEYYIPKLMIQPLLENAIVHGVSELKETGMIAVTGKETEDAIYITVKDNGIGMSDQFLKHIFEPFERERNSTISRVEGSGIGMGIVKRLVELMDGSVDVQSKIGDGSTFTVTIPCKIASKEESIAKRDKGTHDKASLVGARILVVEDNDINAEIATELLEEEGCIIERACNGVECIDMLEKADNSYYAMILMDIQMPVMNGYDATTKIRRMKNQNKAQIPIIAMTANAFTEDKQMAFDVGMNDHVSKPIDMNILVPIMMRYV